MDDQKKKNKFDGILNEQKEAKATDAEAAELLVMKESPPEPLQQAPVVETAPATNQYEADELKKLSARRRKLVFLALSGVALCLCLVAAAKLRGGQEPKKETSQEDIVNQFTKGQLRDPNDLGNRINRNQSRPFSPAPAPQEPTQAQKPQAAEEQQAPAPKAPKTGKSSNREKDEQIIRQYEQVNPQAAAAPGQFVPPAVGNQGARTMFIPGSSQTSGRQAQESPKTDNFGLHGVKVRAKLLFEVISTANNKIFAESTEAIGPLPVGAKFSGTASYANKRAFIQFSEVQFNGQRYAISGTAIQGTSPGLVAEVTDLSTNNAAANTVIGLTRAAGTVAGVVTGGVTGQVVNNITDPHTQEIQRTEETKKVTVEYKVPAKTPLFIYFD